jgi:hypothetical protein
MNELRSGIRELKKNIESLKEEAKIKEDELLSFLISKSDEMFDLWMARFLEINYILINKFISTRADEAKLIQKEIFEQKAKLSEILKEEFSSSYWKNYEKKDIPAYSKDTKNGNPVLRDYYSILYRFERIFWAKGLDIKHCGKEIFDTIKAEVSIKITEIDRIIIELKKCKVTLKDDIRILEIDRLKNKWGNL